MKNPPWVETPLSKEETQYLEEFREGLDDCVKHKTPLFSTMEIITEDLHELGSARFDLRAAKKRGWSSRISALKKRRTSQSGLLSQEESEFLEDLKGFIDYGIRNGVTFLSIMGGIAHDVSELKLDLFDFKAAKKRGWRPMVSGYGKIVSESFQGVEEEE
ncbi:MAG: hypothetical protein L0Y72_07595 [Gemmataceae bacterium]|nr:hypothetical protein [Gemmataceae bacterium]MCI0738892.1 hypothetical protein [Gemmataceae bacterium]